MKPSLEVTGYCGKYEDKMYGTVEVNPEAFGSFLFNEFLENSLVTFRLNALGQMAQVEIEELAFFERSLEPEKAKD